MAAALGPVVVQRFSNVREVVGQLAKRPDVAAAAGAAADDELQQQKRVVPSNAAPAAAGPGTRRLRRGGKFQLILTNKQ